MGSLETAGQDVDIGSKAVLKLLYHAQKFPAFNVCGLLLGSIQGHEVLIGDTIPLFHTISGCLAPCLETALLQASIYAKSINTSVVGYYEGDARATAGTELSPIGRSVGSRIAGNCAEGAVALVLDNSGLKKLWADGSVKLPLELWTQEKGGKWKRGEMAGSTGKSKLGCKAGAAGIPQMFVEGVKNGVHQQLQDFDEHLDNIKADWTNAALDI